MLFNDILDEDGPAKCDLSIVQFSKKNELIDIHPTLLAKAQWAQSLMLQK